MKKIISLVLAAATVMALSACGSSSNSSASTAASSAAASTASKDTLVLGCDVNFAPMGFKDGDNVVGFDIDLAKAVIEDKMGKKLVIQPIDWSSKEAELDTGKVDLLWNGLTITDERKEKMCFSKPYMENKQVIVVKKGSDIKSKADLNGKNVVMQKESTAVDAWKDAGITANVTELKDNVLCLNEISTGRADAAIMDSVVANYYLAKQADQYPFVILDDSLANELYGVAVKKGNEALMEEIQKALDETISDGTAAKIATNWFGSDTMYKG